MNSFLNQTKNRITEFFQLLSKYISQGEINQTSIIIEKPTTKITERTKVNVLASK